MKQIDELTLSIIKESKELYGQAEFLKRNFSFKELYYLTKQVSMVVERYTERIGVMSSKAKLELASNILSALVDIPFIPENLEPTIFKMILKKAVKYLNANGFEF